MNVNKRKNSMENVKMPGKTTAAATATTIDGHYRAEPDADTAVATTATVAAAIKTDWGNGKANRAVDLPVEIAQEYAERLFRWWSTFTEIAWFVLCCLGFIFLDIYYAIFGYPEKPLNADIALITGGGSGLGRLLAERLAKLGTRVVVWDINQKGINETVELVSANGGYCKGYVVDISKKEEVYKAANVVQNEVGDVTLLINNAGVVSGLHLLNTPDHLIERSFNVNVLAHFWTTKAFLPKMIEQERGHIATIASLAGHVGITKLVDYCASKFAAVGFDEALRLELDVLGHTNIYTTCICPFFIQSTGMFDDVHAKWVPTLNPNDVADRIIVAIRKNEKIAVIPGYIKVLLSFKWVFPWGCVGGLLRRLVPDAAPHGFAHNNKRNQPSNANNNNNNNNNHHHVKLTTNGAEPSLAKTTPNLRIKRTTSIGERVL